MVISGVIIDKVGKRSWFLLLLIPEGLLTLVGGFNVGNALVLTILWIFIGILAGFTITGLLGFFIDHTEREHRGKIAGIITGIAWLIAAVGLSYFISALFSAAVLMFTFAVLKLVGGGIAVYTLFSKMEEKSETIVKRQSAAQGFGPYLKESYEFLWADKKFILYLVAFVMVWIAQGLFLPIGGSGQVPAQSYQQIASIGLAAGGLFLILSGFLIDDKGREEVLIYGGFLAAISFISYYFPLGAVFLSGIPVLMTTIIVVLGDIAPPDAKGRYFSVFLLFNFVALFVSWVIGSNLVASQWIALTCIIISTVALIFIYLWGAKTLEGADLDYVERPVSAITAPIIESSSSEPTDTSETSTSEPPTSEPSSSEENP